MTDWRGSEIVWRVEKVFIYDISLSIVEVLMKWERDELLVQMISESKWVIDKKSLRRIEELDGIFFDYKLAKELYTHPSKYLLISWRTLWIDEIKNIAFHSFLLSMPIKSIPFPNFLTQNSIISLSIEQSLIGLYAIQYLD